MVKLKGLLISFLIILVLGLLAFYWLMPFNLIQFSSNPGNSNFSLNSSSSAPEMQFYPNLRYSSSNISYNIDSTLCTIKKQDDMRQAFSIIENLTVLRFHEVSSMPEISITCDDKTVVNENYFVAGEGGPVNITESGSFNVITQGKILLLRESNCPKPNIATHELLHALGFNHSANSNNIMYPITTCDEEIGQDIPALINEIYSAPSYPDILFGETDAVIHGRYLDTNITVLNNGLAKSGNAKLIISSASGQIDEQTVAPLDIGTGITFYFNNIQLSNPTIDELQYALETDFNEISKDNNVLSLKIKK